jgi:uncharacterized protein
MILKFVDAARAAGLRVSTVEVLDSLKNLARVDVLDEPQFATVLRSSFAKSYRERARFDTLYHLFFHELRERLDTTSESLTEPAQTLRKALVEAEPERTELGAIADFLTASPVAYLSLVASLSVPEPAQVAAGDQFGAGLGAVRRRLSVLMALDRIVPLLGEFVAQNRGRIDPETLRALEDEIRRRLSTARRLLLAADRPQPMVPLEPRGAVADVYGELGNTPFANLSGRELRRMWDTIEILVRKLRDSASRRYAAQARGVPDLRRTLRAAMRTQGTPMVIKVRHRPRRKARILALCDLSSSVWSYARFTLTMLYALQDCFGKVRSFVFVDEPVEVTHHFEEHPVERALNEVLRSPEVSFEASTDYGRMLRRFQENHWDAVDKKTTVIIIGDGRTNYRDPAGPVVADLRSRARRLLWLNPESRPFWYTGDSEMRTYEPLCNEVRPCQNLNQLAAFFHELVL